MRKSTGIALISLLVSIVGVVIALAAYFKNHKCGPFDDYLYDDDFYNDDYDDDDDDCDCAQCCSVDEYQNADIDFTATMPEKEEEKQ